jgi:UDP-GlcNAc3NAcA epimerase
MKVVTVVGARPQFIKAAMLSRALARSGVEEELVHTGQHYDDRMSSVFFDELDIPAPSVNLEVGSGTHAVQTGEILVRLERHLLSSALPDRVLVYGDTNSTLAAALVASKLHIPLDHVEAGLRSFNRQMPEEINRIVTDRLSQHLFCPTLTAVKNLAAEGQTEGVILTGDVMRDATLFFASLAGETRPLEGITSLNPGEFAVATIHRAENTDDPARLSELMKGLGSIGLPVLLPLHPRTKKRFIGRALPDNIKVSDPVSYLEMLTLVRAAERVLTDSGGLQKEALWLGTPCITLRDETEWTETLDGGWNQVTGADASRMVGAFENRPSGSPPLFGISAVADSASEHIASVLGGG